MRTHKIHNIVTVMILISLAVIYIGCSPMWAPSDELAAKMVEEYYLFFFGGEVVDAILVERGAYVAQCECFPMKFKIDFATRKNNKTFYFYKKPTGEVAVRLYYAGSAA